MGKVIVRYKVKPERADENVSLVKAVYAELNANKPAGLSYATFVAEDGLTFFHMADVSGDENPLPKTRPSRRSPKTSKSAATSRRHL